MMFTKDDLSSLIMECMDYDFDKYSHEGVDILRDALTDAYALTTRDDVTSDMIHAAYVDVDTKMKALKLKVIVNPEDTKRSRELLQSQIQKTKNSDLSPYDYMSVDRLNKVLDEAEGLFELNDVSEKQFIDAANRIVQTEASLVPIGQDSSVGLAVDSVDTSELEELLDRVQQLDGRIYTPESMQRVTQVAQAVGGRLRRDVLTKEKVYADVQSLSAAYRQLQKNDTPVVEYDALMAMMTKCRAINPRDYTLESALQLSNAMLNTYEKLAEDKKLTSAQLIKLRTDLERVHSGLISDHDGDTDALYALLEDAKNEDLEKYTTDSATNLQNAIDLTQYSLDHLSVNAGMVAKITDVLVGAKASLKLAPLVKAETLDLSIMRSLIKEIDKLDYLQLTESQVVEVNYAKSFMSETMARPSISQAQVDASVAYLLSVIHS